MVNYLEAEVKRKDEDNKQLAKELKVIENISHTRLSSSLFAFVDEVARYACAWCSQLA